MNAARKSLAKSEKWRDKKLKLKFTRAKLFTAAKKVKRTLFDSSDESDGDMLVL